MGKANETQYGDLIPSKDMREYLQKIDHHFSDAEIASLIYNVSRLGWKERRERLKDLAERTDDQELKKQILELVEVQLKAVEDFKTLEPGFIYAVETTERNGELELLGFANNYETAYQSGLLSEDEFEIRKEKLLVSDDQEEGSWETIYFDANGKIRDTYLPEDVIWDKYASNEHFTKRYYYVPTPFFLGDVVYDLGYGEYGIVMANADEEEKRKTDQFLKKWGADESDIEVRICTFSDGEWTGHLHASPYYLEYAHLEDNDPRKDIFNSAKYLMHHGKADMSTLWWEVERAKEKYDYEQENWNEE